MASLQVENVAAAAPAWLRGFLAFAAAKWAGSRLVGSAAGFRAKHQRQSQAGGGEGDQGGSGGSEGTGEGAGGGADALLTSLLARDSSAEVAAAVADQHARELAAVRLELEQQLE